jgi:hypothetical protein
MRFQAETTARPEFAFLEIADFANLEAWDPFVRRSWLEDGASLQEGAKYVIEVPGGMRLDYRIVDVEEPRFAVYQGGTHRVRSTDTIEVAGTDSGSCITVTSELRFRGWIRLIGPLVTVLVWLGGRYVSSRAMRRHLSSLR